MKIEVDSIKKNISNNIIKYREKAGLSQKEFAQRLNTSPSRVSNWEQGANCPSMDILFEVCRVLDVSINDIYGVYPSSSITLTYEEQNHIQKYRLLDPPGKEHVDTVLEWEVAHQKAISEKDARIAEMEVQPAPVQKEFNYLMDEINEPMLNAAHALNGATPEEIQHDEDIMNDDSEWE